MALLLGFCTWLLLQVLIPAEVPKDFPETPDMKSMPPAVGSLIARIDAQARNRPRSADDVGRLGMAYHANQLYRQAESAYTIASRLDPGNYRWIYYQALMQEENGYEQAQFDLLQETIQLRPDYAPALMKLGDIHFKRDQPDEAAGNYDRVNRSAGGISSPQALFGLARIAAKHRDWQKVVEHLAPVSREYPLLRPPHQLLADAYDALGKAESAAEERLSLLQANLTPIPPVKDELGEKLIDLACSSTRLLKEAGLLSRFGNPDLALRLARRAVEVAPDDADARHFVSRMLLEWHGTDPQAVDEALSQLDEGLRLRPDDPLPLYYAAAFFFKQNKTDAAVERLRAMLARNAGTAEAQYYLGLIADRKGRNEEAVAHYQDALRLDADYAEPHHRLGLILASEGRLDEAITHLRKAVLLKPMFTGARCHLGAALEYQGKIDQAIEQYREALRLKPNDTEPRMHLAAALARTGNLDEAILHLRAMVRITPGDAKAYYALGNALAAQGKAREAAEALRRALSLRPDYAEALGRLQELEGRKP